MKAAKENRQERYVNSYFLLKIEELDWYEENPNTKDNMEVDDDSDEEMPFAIIRVCYRYIFYKFDPICIFMFNFHLCACIRSDLFFCYFLNTYFSFSLFFSL